MLEQSSLLLHAWSRQAIASGGFAWVRPIHNATGKPLGFVQYHGEPSQSWFAWLRQTRLDVFETEDASHLMTLTRSWGVLGSWRIDDAEERHVGNVYGKTIVTSENVRLGFVDSEDGCIWDLQSRRIARFMRNSTRQVEVALLPELPANPFVRMLVLGSILTLEPMPI